MAERKPLTIEILGTKDGTPVVLDRVVGGSIYLDEAKRIGQRLLERVEGEAAPDSYRILSPNHELIYEWQAGKRDGSGQHDPN